MTNLSNFYKSICLIFILSISLTVHAAETVEIEINGVEGEILDNVLGHLRLAHQKDHPSLTPSLLKHLHQRAPKEIAKALQTFGYYHSDIDSTLTPPDDDNQTWLAKYTITLNEPIKFTEVNVNIKGEGQENIIFQEFIEDFSIKVGDPLQHSVYEKTKDELRDLAQINGYFDAKFTEHKVLVEKKKNSAKLTLTFDTKQRYRFGEVEFEQDQFTDKFMQNFITFKKDQFYTNDALAEFHRIMMLSDYFLEIILKKKPTVKDNQAYVDLLVKLRLASPNKYRGRIGYGTDTGARISLDWKRRYVNRHGHNFSAGISAQQERNRYIGYVNYGIPTGGQIDRNYLDIGLDFEAEDLDIDNLYQEEFNNYGHLVDNNVLSGTTRATMVSLDITKHHPRSIFGFDVDEAIGMQYFTQKYDIFELINPTLQQHPDFQTLHPILKADYKMFIPYAIWLYQEPKRSHYIRSGQRFRLSIQGSDSNLGSNVSFWQTRLEANLIRPISKKGRLILRGAAGYTGASAITVNDKDYYKLPEGLLFKTGGDRTVRGYKYEELDNDGLGGIHTLVGSIEYEHHIAEKWGVATFFDIGNAFNSFKDMDLQQGAGIGLRWYSPVGVVRLDVASALSKDKKPFRIHFTIGTEF